MSVGLAISVMSGDTFIHDVNTETNLHSSPLYTKSDKESGYQAAKISIAKDKDLDLFMHVQPMWHYCAADAIRNQVEIFFLMPEALCRAWSQQERGDLDVDGDADEWRHWYCDGRSH